MVPFRRIPCIGICKLAGAYSREKNKTSVVYKSLKRGNGGGTAIDLMNFVSDKGAGRAFMKFRRNPHGR